MNNKMLLGAKFGILASIFTLAAILITSSSFFSYNSPMYYAAAQTQGSQNLNFGKLTLVSSDNQTCLLLYCSELPSVAESGNNVYVVWEDFSPGNYDVFFAKSSDGGNKFGSPINLSHDFGNSTFPAVAASGNNVYVVWADNTVTKFNPQLYFAKSTDGGSTFTDPSNIGLGGNEWTYNPKIAVGENSSTIYVTWASGRVGTFLSRQMFTMSTSAGDDGTFSTSKVLGPETAYYNPGGAIAASGKSVIVAWLENRTGTADLFLGRSTDGGASFGRSVYIAYKNHPEFSLLYPSVSIAGNNVYVSWNDNFTGNINQAKMTKSTNGGLSWLRTIQLSNVPQGINAALQWMTQAVSGNNVYVAWDTNASSLFKIEYVGSTNGATSFTKPIVISHSTGDSAEPSIAVSRTPPTLYLAFADTRTGVSNIYFTKAAIATSSPPVGPSPGPTPTPSPIPIGPSSGGNTTGANATGLPSNMTGSPSPSPSPIPIGPSSGGNTTGANATGNNPTTHAPQPAVRPPFPPFRFK